MFDRASTHGTSPQFSGRPCKSARSQHQTSKPAAVLLALIENNVELAHARSLLATHDDMTKSPRSMQHGTDSTELISTMSAGD